MSVISYEVPVSHNILQSDLKQLNFSKIINNLFDRKFTSVPRLNSVIPLSSTHAYGNYILKYGVNINIKYMEVMTMTFETEIEKWRARRDTMNTCLRI